jgi:RNA recognition motif-containing protein
MADQVTPAVTSTEPMSKVFVGNLAFRTTDQDLQVLFKDCGEIKAGVIITRGRRSLGYGFIEFVKPEDAAACVEVMNKKDFLGRPLKVELAKDPSERPDRLERTGSDDADSTDKAPAPKRGRKPAAEGVQPVQTQTQVSQINATGAPKAKRAKKPKAAAPEAGSAPAPVAVDEKGPSAKRKATRPRNKKKKLGGNPVISENNSAPVVTAPVAPAGDDKPKKKREPKQPRVPPAERVNSKTTLFVANLPFTIADDTLADVFKGYNVKSAHVVRTYNNRSRGYGFVEFESEADQLKAMNEKNGATLPSLNGEPRAIAISISSSNGSAPEQTTDQTPK